MLNDGICALPHIEVEFCEITRESEILDSFEDDNNILLSPMHNETIGFHIHLLSFFAQVKEEVINYITRHAFSKIYGYEVNIIIRLRRMPDNV